MHSVMDFGAQYSNCQPVCNVLEWSEKLTQITFNLKQNTDLQVRLSDSPKPMKTEIKYIVNYWNIGPQSIIEQEAAIILYYKISIWIYGIELK